MSGEQSTRTGFGGTVLVGLAAGGLCALAGSRAWADTSDSALGQVTGVPGLGTAIDDASAPPVTALGLVLLAVWGVLLVTRGRFRVVVAWLGLVVSVGLLVLAVAAWVQAPRAVRDALERSGSADPEVGRTVWGLLAVLAAVAGLLAGVQGVRRVRAWPEMSRRYDAPGDVVPPRRGAAVAGADDDPERTSLDLWRDLDDGHDPTADPTDDPADDPTDDAQR